jgi:hypothetical protein
MDLGILHGHCKYPGDHTGHKRQLLTVACFQPHARAFENQSAPLSFAAFVLVFVGVTDLMSLSMPEEISLLYHWGTQGSSASMTAHQDPC